MNASRNRATIASVDSNIRLWSGQQFDLDRRIFGKETPCEKKRASWRDRLQVNTGKCGLVGYIE
jgi:hypothetical protein